MSWLSGAGQGAQAGGAAGIAGKGGGSPTISPAAWNAMGQVGSQAAQASLNRQDTTLDRSTINTMPQTVPQPSRTSSSSNINNMILSEAISNATKQPTGGYYGPVSNNSLDSILDQYLKNIRNR